MDNEATPTLQPVPGIDLAEYKPNLIARFSNPQIRDTLARLCMESSDRIPKWLLPVVRENLASGGPIELTAAVVASWARYAEAVDEQGEPIVVIDRLRDSLVATAQTQGTDRLAFVRNRELFGNLVDNERFTTAYLAALDSLHSHAPARPWRTCSTDLTSRVLCRLIRFAARSPVVPASSRLYQSRTRSRCSWRSCRWPSRESGRSS